jgi:hypothetical protein
MEDIYKRLFSCKFWVLLLIVTIVIFLVNAILGTNNAYSLLITSVIASILASFLVGVFFQYFLMDEISKEHLKIIEHKDEFNKSGILKYYSSFKNCVEDLRTDIRSTKRLTLYVAYGNTALNMLSEEISNLLSKEGSTLNIYFLDATNPFLSGYAKLWGYTEENLKKKINDSIELLKNKKEELSRQNRLKGELNVFLLLKYPIHYSFYFCDDILYFVPSKHYESKEFVPLTIKAQKSTIKGALYNKISEDLSLIDKAEVGVKKLVI